jgi:hypothetical protein
MVAVHTSPIQPTFNEFIDQLGGESMICSPFISIGPVRQLVTKIQGQGVRDDLQLTVLTDLSVRNVVQGSTDIAAIVFLREHIPRSSIRHLPSIHAKVYIANGNYALVTSANFTDGGASKNREYGLSVRDPELVNRIASDISEYAALGADVSLLRLRSLSKRISSLKSLISEEQQSINAKFRAVATELEQEAEEELLRARVAGRAIHAVFADTILYLLGKGAMPTTELHAHVRGIHPDLCDEFTDRVIDGQHFGKLWKHQVRTAQQYLKRTGMITNDPASRLWRKAASD